MQGPLHQLMDDHRGRLKLVYIHTPISPRSVRAAEAAECAYRQGKFWQYKDRLFAEQPAWTRADDWQERLLSYGRDAGLDPGALVRCLQSGEVRPAVQSDIRASETYGIRFTPTIIMSDGSRFVGSDIEPLRKAVEGALRLSGGR